MGEKDFLELGGAEDLSSNLETKSTLCGFQPKPSIKVRRLLYLPNTPLYVKLNFECTCVTEIRRDP